ncbi:MAG TPA: hypothetical protein DGL25_02040 [Dehalococcoidia bacterium]|nr:hypothetical protein [Dehalococcoidia bacterium]
MKAPSFVRYLLPLSALSQAENRACFSPRSWNRKRILAGTGLVLALAGVATLSLLTQDASDPQTAFARAPSGQYAVVARNTGDNTIVTVVGADKSDSPIEIATVPHLNGFSARGEVSPSGLHVALVTPDSISHGRPIAALVTLNLETGELRRIAEGLDPLQNPLLRTDSTAIVVTRNASNTTGIPVVQVIEVTLDGTETVLETHTGAGLVAPIGFDMEGRLLTIKLDSRGSTLTRAGTEIRWLSTHITRDWSLSPDGSRLAFVEANTWRGLRYLPRIASIEGNGGVTAASTSNRQALGTTWKPSGSPLFGNEPYAPLGGVRAQAESGFDVPLEYSWDGSSLAVHHWSGNSFDNPGTPRLEVVSRFGRKQLNGFTRFYGWSAR